MSAIKSGYTISLAGRERDEREHWTATCACGWWIHGQVSRRAAEAALERHRSHDSRHAA